MSSPPRSSQARQIRESRRLDPRRLDSRREAGGGRGWVLAVVVLLGCWVGRVVAQDPVALEPLEEAAWQAAVNRVAPSVVRLERLDGTTETPPATGVVVSTDGLVVTSSHWIPAAPPPLLCLTPTGQRLPAELVARDHSRLIALLRVAGLTAAPIPPPAPAGEVRVGQWAIAVGRTFPGSEPNRSVGIISARERIWGRALQTDAKVSPANYGGPLVDVRGRVLGLLVPLAPDGTPDAVQVAWYDSGIGFAVPWEQVLAAVPRLAGGNDLRSGLAGVTLGTSDPLAPVGALASVRPGTPAARAGLLPGDEVYELDGRSLARVGDWKRALGPKYAGDTLALRYRRGGEEREASLTLTDELPVYRRPLLGVRLAREAPSAPAEPGVLVRQVEPESPAALAGIVAGARLVSVNGQPLVDPSAWRQRIGQAVAGDVWQLTWKHHGQERTADVTLAPGPPGLLENDPDGPSPADAETPPPSAAEPNGREPQADSAPLEPAPLELRVPESRGRAWAWIPAVPDAAAPRGALVWMPGPSGWSSEDERTNCFRRFAPLAERAGLAILLPQPAEGPAWTRADLEQVGVWIDELGRGLELDRERVVCGGDEAGAALAWLAGWVGRSRFRGLVLVEAPLSPRVPENDPQAPVALLALHARVPGEDSARAIAAWRTAGYSVDERVVGSPAPQSPAATEVLTDWFDALDRL